MAAGLNRPVTTGDKIWSDNDGRIELQLDGSLLRLSQNTGCSFLNLSDNVTQVQLTAGTLLVRVRRLEESETWATLDASGAEAVVELSRSAVTCGVKLKYALFRAAL